MSTVPKRPVVSVVVPTYDQWPRLRLALLGFTRMRTRDPWELIVVDDGCTTPIAELVARDRRFDVLPIRVERLDVNRGRSIARNHGAAVARGRLCLFLDGDAVPHPSWVESHTRLLRTSTRVFTLGHIRSIPSTELFADPSTGALFDHLTLDDQQLRHIEANRDRMIVTDDQVLGDVDALYERSQWGSVPMPPQLVARWLAWLLHRECPGAPPLLWSRFVPHNCGVHRRDFEAVGGFDPNFTFFEGVDLAYRLTKLGARPRVAERAVSLQLYHFHDFGSPTSEESVRRARGAVQLVEKHPTPEMAVIASALTASPRPDEALLIHPAEAIAALRCGAHDDHARLVRLHPALRTAVAAYPNTPEAADPLLTHVPRTTEAHARQPEWMPLSTWLATLGELASATQLAGELPPDMLTVRDGVAAVDWRAAETWALANDAAFYRRWLQMDSERMAFIHRARTSPSPGIAAYRFDYETTVDVSAVPRGTLLRLDLPFPCHTEHQRVVRVLYGDPPIDDHVLAHTGCIYGMRIRRAAETIVVRYAADLEVAEVRRGVAHSRALSTAGRDEHARYLSLPQHDREGVQRTLAAIAADTDHAPHSIARAIRDWVLANVQFTLVERCPCFECCLGELDRKRAGGCTFIASVFVALARAAGIPARLVRGSLLGFPTAPGTFRTRTTNLGFGHRWAEFFARPVGWIPVEFHSCVLQPPILTERNAPSAAERDAILADGAACADYLFGSLDNQRVRCGTFAFGVTPMPVRPGAPRPALPTVTTITMTRLAAERS